MNDEETSTSDAPTTTISPVSRDPVDREEKQEMEVTTLGEQVGENSLHIIYINFNI